MVIKTSFAGIIFLLCGLNSAAQFFDMEEKKPQQQNGFEYGFVINNEQLKTAKGEEYSRYEITLYVSNNSGCSKIYAEKTNAILGEDNNLLATFNCRNANGKRFTAKSGTIKARDFYVSVKHKVNDKETTETVKTGYVFRNGETLKTNIIILVPKGERPQIDCTVNTPFEIQ